MQNLFSKWNSQLSGRLKNFMSEICQNVQQGDYQGAEGKSLRSSHLRCSVRKGVLWNLAKFSGKHLCQSLFFNKVAGLRPATLQKRASSTDVFLWI